MTPETQIRTSFDQIAKVNNEYRRGLITGIEFLAELTAQVKEIEYARDAKVV